MKGNKTKLNIKIKFKPLLVKNKWINNGRGSCGKLLVRGRRNGKNKERINLIDTRRNIHQIKGLLVSINTLQTDRNIFIGNVYLYEFFTFYNIALSTNFELGQEVISNSRKVIIIKPGDSNFLKNLNLGVKIYNVANDPYGKAKYSCSAGTNSILFRFVEKKDKRFIGIILPSGKKKYIAEKAHGTFGSASNHFNRNHELDSAGKSFLLGKRPIVRGVAMNPVDHPHGGGEGKTTAGGHPVSKWGKLTKGKKTVRRKKNLIF